MSSPRENRALPRYRWVVRETDPDSALKSSRDLADKLGCSPLLARILIARGFDTPDEARKYLSPDASGILPPEAIPGIEKARDRLIEAIRNREQVMVHGDYDVDGIVGAVILHSTLKELGCPSRIYLPKREAEGFGLSVDAIRKAKGAGISLIVSVDCGISSHEAVETAIGSGIEVIVTDHHALPDIMPPASILVHPDLGGDYPGGRIAGATVAYKLVLSILEKLKRNVSAAREKLLPLVALATVADVCPLTLENRSIVAMGIARMPRTEIPGLIALHKGTRRDALSDKIEVRDIAFGMAPCLNAAGRMGDPFPAAKLLLAKDMDTAWRCFRELKTLNTERKRIQEEVTTRLAPNLESEQEDRILVLADEKCLPGLAGLAAARLAERTGKPTCVLVPCRTVDPPVYRGSMRTSGGENLLDLMEPILAHVEKLGGHPGAIGLTVSPDRLHEFMDACRTIEWTPKPSELHLDLILDRPPGHPAEVTELDKTRPWGEGNPRPAFLWDHVSIRSTRIVGRTGDHLQLSMESSDGSEIKGIGFSMAEWCDHLTTDTSARAAGHFIINDWSGTDAVEFQAADFDPL